MAASFFIFVDVRIEWTLSIYFYLFLSRTLGHLALISILLTSIATNTKIIFYKIFMFLQTQKK